MFEKIRLHRMAWAEIHQFLRAEIIGIAKQTYPMLYDEFGIEY